MRKWILIGLIALLVAALIGIAFFGLFSIRPPRQFRIAAGPQGGNYYQTAMELREVLARKGFRVQVIETNGSLDNVAMLQSGRADVGILQGGTATVTDTSGLQTLAVVGYEPVWLFYDAAGGARTITRLPQLRGLRVGIGAPGSGTQSLARLFLDEVGVSDDNTTLVQGGMVDSAEMLRNGQLDAAFFVTSPQTPLITELANDPRLKLYATEMSVAIERRFPFMRSVTLPQGTFSLAGDNPPDDVPLAATRTSIVSRAGFHPDLVRLLLAELPEVIPVPLVGERGTFPNLTETEIPANPDAEQFFAEGPTPLDRVLPFEIASPLSRLYLLLLPLLVFAFPLWTLSKAIFNWYMKSRIIGFYPQILAIERQVHVYTLPEVDEKLAFLRDLDAQVAQRIRVTAGYMPSYYQMRRDIRYVITRLEQRREQLLAGKADPQPQDKAHTSQEASPELGSTLAS